MKPVEQTSPKKASTVIRDASFNKYDNVELFPEKVAKAKETIARVGVPKKLRPNT